MREYEMSFVIHRQTRYTASERAIFAEAAKLTGSLSIASSMAASGITLAAWATGVAAAPVVVPIALTAAVYGIVAWRLNDMAKDPPSNDYKTNPTPQLPDRISTHLILQHAEKYYQYNVNNSAVDYMTLVSTIGSQAIERLDEFLNLTLTVSAYSKVIKEALDRADGAHIDNATLYEQQQLVTANSYISQLANLTQQLPSTYLSLLTSLNLTLSDLLNVTPPARSPFNSSFVYTNGAIDYISDIQADIRLHGYSPLGKTIFDFFYINAADGSNIMIQQAVATSPSELLTTIHSMSQDSFDRTFQDFSSISQDGATSLNRTSNDTPHVTDTPHGTGGGGIQTVNSVVSGRSMSLVFGILTFSITVILAFNTL